MVVFNSKLGQDPKQQIDVLKSVCEQKVGIYLENMLITVLVQNLEPELDNLIQDCISKRLTLSFVGVLIGSVEMQNISFQQLMTSITRYYFLLPTTNRQFYSMGKCLLQMCSVLGELERTLIRERISMGVKTKMSKVGTWEKSISLLK